MKRVNTKSSDAIQKVAGGGVKDMKFSQVAAVSRCRGVKEEKLKEMFNLTKMLDEEVIAGAEINERQLEQQEFQLRELSISQTSQELEFTDFVKNKTRKQSLFKLVDRVVEMKRFLRFQEECREKAEYFKSSIKSKREMFHIRMARLEVRQIHERNELVAAQLRLATTMAQIKNIELKQVEDSTVARRKQRENELAHQQLLMKQQKESEFMREIQLCKLRHLTEFHEKEIRQSEELHDLISLQSEEVFTEVEKGAAAEAEALREMEREVVVLDAARFQEKQQTAAQTLQRTQKKQAWALEQETKAHSKIREKAFLAENRYARGSFDTSKTETTSHDYEQGSEDSEAHEQELEQSFSKNGSSWSLSESTTNKESEESQQDDASKQNTASNSIASADQNKAQLKRDHARRLAAIRDYQRRVLMQLKVTHKRQIAAKTAEHRHSMKEIMEDHAEELQKVKAEQENVMEELLKLQSKVDDQLADTGLSQRLLSMMLPSNIIEEIEAGKKPQPTRFAAITIFFTDIYGFKKLVGEMQPENILKMLNIIYTKFDDIIAKYTKRLYKVESVSDTYMVAAGLNRGTEQSEEEITLNAKAALDCVQELCIAFRKMDFQDLTEGTKIALKVGVHTGQIFGGLVGTKMSRYCLFGDTVNTSSRMCTTGEAGKVQISPTTYALLKNDRNYKFTERGSIEVKGKGLMKTHWLEVK